MEPEKRMKMFNELQRKKYFVNYVTDYINNLIIIDENGDELENYGDYYHYFSKLDIKNYLGRFIRT